jgi:hypothetical protein
MVDPISLVALILSAVSIILWGMKEGIRLPLEFRESEETSRRRETIEKKLGDEVKKELGELQKSLVEKEGIGEKELEDISNLGRHAFFARSASSKMLEDMTFYMSNALTTLAMGLVALVITVFYGLVIIDVLNPNNALMLFLLAGFTMILFIMTYYRVKNHYILRKAFIELSENANLEDCEELVEELRDKKLW